MANVGIQIGYKNSAWFTTNAALILKVGQVVYLEQTGTYKIGDGTTVLSALSFLGAASSITKTSDLINDGDDGVSHFISLNDLPSNIILYPTTSASDISGYFKLVSSISDASYDVVAVNVSTGAITTTNQLISSLATSANILVGNPGVFNITTIGNITRVSGTGTAEFYFEVYKRTLAGTETLIVTSSNTIPVTNSGYSEFSATGLWNDGNFLSTDRIVLKFYANRIVTGSDPTYNFQFGGSTPVRTLLPVPLTVTPSNVISIVSKDIADSSALTGTTAITLMKSILIPANTYLTGDVVKILNRAIRNTATGAAINYFYVNTTNSLTGATLIGTQSASSRFYAMERNLYIKSSTISETVDSSTSVSSDNPAVSTSANSNLNIDWSVNQYIISAFQNAAVGNSTVMSSLIIQKY
ncbi:hypothetical protein UFOVP1393_40 [uncultured Caudovirales phage]|uniref:Uncharacterized protein n=1 Tax=uncultured Caudovirales phage TaxID=2100421 RepID=A0A6J5S6Z0_9CAUD|nr:hypothetical protein UFOVP1393_40 [uncultured Caudovirales phage]